MKKKKRIICVSLLLALLLLAGCGAKNGAASNEDKEISQRENYTNIEELKADGVKIGVLTGSIYDAMMRRMYPNAAIEYFNDYPSMAYLVRSGELDSYAAPKSIALQIIREISGVTMLDEVISSAEVGAIFPKTPEGAALRDEFSTFINEMKADGTLDELIDAWFLDDTAKQNTDTSKLTGENGTLRMAVSGDLAPINFIRNGEIVGLDVDLAIRFCEARGYALDIFMTDFSGIIPGIGTMADFTCNGIAITEERKEQVYFSDPYYKDEVYMMVATGQAEDGTSAKYKKLAELNRTDIKLGVQTGTTFDTIINDSFPLAEKKYYNTAPDLAYQTANGAIDGFPIDEPVAKQLLKEISGLAVMDEYLEKVGYAFAFPKNSEGEKLCDELTEFITRLKADGTMAEILSVWENDERGKQVYSFDGLTGENGTLRLATQSGFAPFSFVRDGEVVGIDTDILIRFCREYGYALEINDMNFEAIIPSLGSMCSIGGSGMSVTEERMEQVYFSEPYYDSGTVMVVAAESMEEPRFWDGLKESFNKTFIREDRWKLIAQGIGTTVYITVFSAIFGTVLGFGLCMLRRLKNPVSRALTGAYIRIMQGTPMVVLLMILFYVVFAGSALSGEWVAIVAFSLNFAAYVSEMMRTGIEAVDRGQTEAALAIGFTPAQTFFNIVFPQAAQHFLPVYKGEFISLVKGTSIVGYIAVQDLTKMSDIIRSRTYEAFFPLIATAIIYFIISALLASLLNLVELKIEPDRKHRSVKGVKLS